MYVNNKLNFINIRFCLQKNSKTFSKQMFSNKNESNHNCNLNHHEDVTEESRI